MPLDNDPPASTDPAPQRRIATDRLIFGALLALATASVFLVLEKGADIIYALVALYCFAIAIPFLAFSFSATMVSQQRNRRRVQIVFDLLGCVVTVVGFSLLFFEVSLGLGAAFLAAVLFVLFLGRWLR